MEVLTLDPLEARVAGCLVEKQLTTPQQYPLTLNALTLACNQTSNRDPVMSLAEAEVDAALGSLKHKGVVRFVLPSHGRSVLRYRHVLDEKLALDDKQLALVAVLLLRGPQTSGELRIRTDRMARFDSTGEVESDLEGLTRRQPALVQRTYRRPGQKEDRWLQLLSPPGPDGDGAGHGPTRSSRDNGAGADGGGPARDGVEQLRAEVDDLRREVGDLAAALRELRALLGA